MTKVQKFSLDELLRLNEGLTDLFASGLSNGLLDTTEEKSYNLFLLLRYQGEIQEEIRKRILKVIPQCELESVK